MTTTGNKNSSLGTKGLVSLTWNEYDSFVISGFSTLYQNDDLADVTLICEGRSFKAHRVILSVWSTYFREIFISNPAPNPIVILRQTSSEDFELILRFMYQGKILVPQDDADRFLKTAENFKIAGLGKMKIQSHPNSFMAQPNGVVSSTLSDTTDLTTFLNVGPSSQVINLKPVASDPLETTVTTNTPSPLHKSTINCSSLSTSSTSVQNSVVDNHTIKVNNMPNQPFKPFPIFQRQQQQKLQSNRTHSTEIAATTLREMDNYPTETSNISTNINSNSASVSILAKVEPKPEVQSVMVLENFIPTDADVQAIVDTSREETVTESIFSTLYNPMSGGSKQKIIQIQNQSDGSIIGYTFIAADDQNCTTVEETSENANFLSESPMSSSPHSHQSVDNQCPEVIDFDVDESAHSSVEILSDIGTAVQAPTTTISITEAPKQGNKRRRSKKRKGNELSDGDEDVKDVEERVACPTCSKIVKKTSLKVHMKRSHLEEGVVLLCPICGKQVSSRGVYYKHMYMHRRKSEFPSQGDGIDDFENENEDDIM